MGPYAAVDYNLMSTPEPTPTHLPWATLRPSFFHAYNRVDLNRNPVPESTLSPSQGLWIWPRVSNLAPIPMLAEGGVYRSGSN
jgi:hypothetical protein